MGITGKLISIRWSRFPGIFSRSLLIMFLFNAMLSSCKTTQQTTQPSQQKPTTSTPPPKTDPAATEVVPEKKMEIVKRRFVLIMPFELEKNFAEKTDEDTEPEVNPSSLNALGFFEGATIAVDSLKSAQVDIKINSYDTPSDSAGIVRMMTNATVKEADVVIGTFPNNLVPVAANVAKQHNIKLVLTQAGSPEVLLDNSNVAIAYASSITQCREMVAYMMEQVSDANIILVFRTTKREEELATVFRQEILRLKGTSDFQDFNATKKEYTELPSVISKTKRNLVFLISSDEAFVSPVLTLLEEQNIFGIKVSGLPTWMNFESIDFMTFNNLQVHLFDNNFIESDQPDKQQFRKLFISRYQTYPVAAAYNGFDLVYHIGATLKEPYPGMDKLMQNSFSNNTRAYNFAMPVTGGIENKSISVLKIADYKLERLNK